MCSAYPRLTPHCDGLLEDLAMEASDELHARMHAGLKQLGGFQCILYFV